MRRTLFLIGIILGLGAATLFVWWPMLAPASAQHDAATTVPSPSIGRQPTATLIAHPTHVSIPTPTSLPTDTPVPPTLPASPTVTQGDYGSVAVVFQSATDGSLLVIDPATGALSVLADPTDAGQLLPWAASPDGSSIAVITGRDWHNHALTASLWVVTIDATQPRKLLDLLGNTSNLDPEHLRQMLTDERSQQLAWTTDGESIIVTSAHEGDLDRYAVSVIGEHVERLDQRSDLAPQPLSSAEEVQPATNPQSLSVGTHAESQYFFALGGEDSGWQLYRDTNGDVQALGPILADAPVSPRLVVRSVDSVVEQPSPTAAPIEPTPEAPVEDPSAPPIVEPIDPNFNALHTELETMIASWAGDHAVSVTDLQTGQTISVNGDRPQLAACTLKIAIMMVVAQDIEAGRYTAEEIDGLVRSAMGPSNTMPARELLQLIGDGDIGAGLDRVNQLMWDLGAKHSIMTHPPGYFWEEYGYLESHGTDENLLTAEDVNTILGALYRGEALSPSATDYVLWSMSLAPDWMNASLGGPLPTDATLYHKIGQLYEPENTWNDGGIVIFDRNGQQYAYAITYLGSYDTTWQDSYAHASALSEVVWRYFDGTY